MEKETLKKIIKQIKKYDLSGSFADTDKFKNWLAHLNSRQINNFLSLDIDLKEIKNLKHLLINNNLLNCNDYKEKIALISTLKNGDGCWHLFNVICKPSLLNSNHFYQDIAALSQSDNPSYVLSILWEDAFINSPYHDEDLKLIVDSHNPNYLTDLAVNKVSLKDKYHLENMQILAKNPIASDFLYIIMTDPTIIKGKYYRKEVELLLNAQSRLTARALYYYIVNPERKFDLDRNLRNEHKFDIEDARFQNEEYASGKSNPNYIDNLIEISQTSDKYVMHYTSLLMNPSFINSPNKSFDLELLHKSSNKAIFMSLYILMSNEDSQNSHHHKHDAILISQTEDDDIRGLLLDKAIDEYSLTSNNHEFDMEYISRLKIDSIDEKIYKEIYYYLFDQKGLSDSKHKEKLEQLSQGILVERRTGLSSYLDTLQTQLENNESDSYQITEAEEKPKILSLIRKYVNRKR